jgi:hypothetical protein
MAGRADAAIDVCADLATLDMWLSRAATAPAADEVFRPR